MNSALNQITRKLTAFQNFAELVDATAADYRPTIDTSKRNGLRLANAYDACMESRADDRRAFRVGA